MGVVSEPLPLALSTYQSPSGAIFSEFGFCCCAVVCHGLLQLALVGLWRKLWQDTDGGRKEALVASRGEIARYERAAAGLGRIKECVCLKGRLSESSKWTAKLDLRSCWEFLWVKEAWRDFLSICLYSVHCKNSFCGSGAWCYDLLYAKQAFCHRATHPALYCQENITWNF